MSKRKKKTGVKLYPGDSVEVTPNNRLFKDNVGEITHIEGPMFFVEFINSGVYFGSGMYERHQLRRCAPLIPLTG